MTSFLLALLLLAQVSAGLQAQTGVVTGILRTDTGSPVEGVRVAVTPAYESADGSLLESLGLTDSTGRYRLENVSPGRYNILVGRGSPLRYHPGVVELERATTIQVVAGSTIEVPDMIFGGKNVRGRVVDLATGQGRRIENLVLCCDYSQLVPMGAIPNMVGASGTFTAKVSSDGSFVFPPVPPGNYSLSTVDPEIIPVSWALAVGENHVTGLQLDVTEGVEVQGTVQDQTGEPATAVVRLRPNPTNSVFNTIGSPTNTSVSWSLLVPRTDSSLDGLRDRLLKSATVHSETVRPDGHFAFQRVYPGAYLLEVSTMGVNLLEREIQVGIAGLTNVSLQVAAIQVTGRVIAPSGGPLPKLNYIRLVRSGMDMHIFYGFPDTEGRFSLLLLPGQYRVFTEHLGPSVQSVSDGLRNITNTEFTFEGGRNPQIVVTLEP